MNDQQSYFAANRELWNKRTAIHAASSFYDLEGFKKGGSSLNKIELEELGDVNGKSLLHLQCHFGMDTMSWQRLGAVCTGVDFSDEAIGLAKTINDELNLDTVFACSNIYDLKDVLKTTPEGKVLKGSFDIVFTSYGTIGWLPDLNEWAAIIAYFLKPGGIFYIVDFHPVIWMMDEKFEHVKYDYFNSAVIAEAHTGTYTDREAPIKLKEYGWNHPFSEIIQALIHNGLFVLQFNEYPFSPYNCFENLEQGADGMWRIRGMDEKIPMLYSIKAVKNPDSYRE